MKLVFFCFSYLFIFSFVFFGESFYLAFLRAISSLIRMKLDRRLLKKKNVIFNEETYYGDKLRRVDLLHFRRRHPSRRLTFSPLN
jgi:hypothetical protein